MEHRACHRPEAMPRHFIARIAEPTQRGIERIVRHRAFPGSDRGKRIAARPRKRLQRPEQFDRLRSEEHTSELQSLMRISYAVFCLKKKKTNIHNPPIQHYTK